MKKHPAVYDKKALLKCLVGLGLLVVAMYTTGGAGFLVIVPFAFAAFFMHKPASLFYYLLMTVAAVMGNQFLMPKDMVFSISQRAMLMIMGGLLTVQLFGQRNHFVLKPMLMLIPYMLFMLISSAQGWCPFISYLKILLFGAIFVAYYGIGNQMAIDARSSTPQVRSVVLSFACFFILGSMALIPFPAIGQLSGEEYVEALRSGNVGVSLFKGITMQSQSLGPTVAIIFAVLFADFIFSVRRSDKLYLLLMLCCPYLIYKTSSRTAMGSLIIAALMPLWLSMKDRGIGIRWRSKVFGAMLGIFALGAACALAVPSVRESILNFATKTTSRGAKDSVTMEQVVMSRQGKWDEGIYNFKKSPWLGNGFQVSEQMSGLRPNLKTLSAPIEKSVWISAILEEGGIVGFILFTFFIVYAYHAMVKRKAYIGATAFVVLLVTNLGEFTIFSLSYTGGLLWAMVFAGLVLDAERMKEQRRYDVAMRQ